MTITIHAQGTERKRLVQVISKWLALPANYCGAPSFEYKIGRITVKKDGSLEVDDSLNNEAFNRLLTHLYEEGFNIDLTDTGDCPIQPEGMAVIIPRSQLDDETLEKLKVLIKVKGPLICKALNVDSLPLEVTDTEVKFDWFVGSTTPEEFEAYGTFVCKLCELARKQKRINITDKTVTNEKYAFRCFLLRLGFIGDEYKPHRKILLRHLTGSAAFKEVPKNEDAE